MIKIIDISIIFLIEPQLFKGIHEISLNIREFFLDIKMRKVVKKKINIKQACIVHNNCNFFDILSVQKVKEEIVY